MSTPQVRLDRSKDFSTVHGERPPGDPHAGVFFFQDGLPFNAQGVCVDDHPSVVGNEKLQAVLAKKLRKLNKSRPIATDTALADAAVTDNTTAVVEDDDDEEDDDGPSGQQPGPDGLLPPVDLKRWLRGDEDYIWNDVSNAIALEYTKRPANKRDAVNFLVSKGVADPAQVAKHFQKLLD